MNKVPYTFFFAIRKIFVFNGFNDSCLRSYLIMIADITCFSWDNVMPLDHSHLVASSSSYSSFIV